MSDVQVFTDGAAGPGAAAAVAHGRHDAVQVADEPRHTQRPPNPGTTHPPEPHSPPQTEARLAELEEEVHRLRAELRLRDRTPTPDTELQPLTCMAG